MRTAFWALVVLDLCGILLLFALGLAAAGSSGTSPIRVTFFLLVLPSIPLAAAAALFLRSTSPAGRALALLLAATPLLLLALAKALGELQFRAATNESGQLTFFRSGPMREMAEAIARNDAATVTTLAPRVNVNESGLSGMTLLVLATRELRDSPGQHDALRALLAAGADANRAAQYELPLAIAIQVSGKAGTEPVRMLLDAGADPNLMTPSGEPVYFQATGRSSTLETLALLLDRGADVNATGSSGATALFSAANTRNWRAALLLLQRGADWNRGKSTNGQSFRTMVDGYADAEGGDSVYAAVRRIIQ
ncbi:MAG: hypothetical protein MNPFHGCM_02602 [Gemmatimonadaceae bacterium]|nr:hypothetical protein [Gemmatimonadaceae bacterium]